MAVLLLGLALRIVAVAWYFPAIMTVVDSPRFARAGSTGLFDDFWMPAGYPAFLKVIHRVSDQVWVPISLQHLIGLGVAVALYATLRRVRAPTVVALLPTAYVALSGDLLYLEHVFLADQFLFVFSTLACCCAVVGLVPRIDWRWLVAAGVLAMFATLSRTVGVAVVVALAVVVATLAPAFPRRRLLATGGLLSGSLAVLLVYVAVFASVGGTYLGLGDMSGWNLYTRVASFADCADFTPPKETRKLCEARPPSQRPGPFGYVWDANSISRRQFAPLGPETAKPLGKFARTVIVHQPLDYLEAVGTDLSRYVEPTIGRQNGYDGQPRELVSFGFRDPGSERLVEAALAPRYSGTKLSAPGAGFLDSYQQIVRLDRLTLLLALILTLVGAVLARGAARIVVATFGLSALGLYVLPTLTLSYDFRYGIPPAGLLAVSATVAAWGLYQRRAAATISEQPAPTSRPGGLVGSVRM